jgi:hypothetical protein
VQHYSGCIERTSGPSLTLYVWCTDLQDRQLWKISIVYKTQHYVHVYEPFVTHQYPVYNLRQQQLSFLYRQTPLKPDKCSWQLSLQFGHQSLIWSHTERFPYSRLQVPAKPWQRRHQSEQYHKLLMLTIFPLGSWRTSVSVLPLIIRLQVRCLADIAWSTKLWLKFSGGWGCEWWST